MENWSSPVTAERVYIHLHERADAHRRVVTTSRALSREMDEVSPTTVVRSIARLADTGALEVIRHGGRHPSVYRVLREPDYELAEMFSTRSPAA